MQVKPSSTMLSFKCRSRQHLIMEVFLPTFFEDSVWTTFGTAVLSAKDGKSLTTKLNWIFKSGDRVCIINQCKAYKKDKQG